MPKELILYLEPRPTSELGSQLHQFFTHSHTAPWGKHTNNEALKYPPHITMVGFFNAPSECAPTCSIEQIVAFLDQATTPICSQQQTIVEGLIRPNRTSLLLAVQPASTLTDMVQRWAAEFPDLGLRCKKINHLSLSYWDDDHTVPEAELQAREEWVDRAQTLAVAACPWLTELETVEEKEEAARISREHASEWDVVLYEIEGRVRSRSAEYPLVEVKRWAL